MNIKIIKKISITFILLTSIILFASCTGQKVQTVEEEIEANQILDLLREHNLSAYKVDGGEGDKRFFEIYVNGGEEEYGGAIQLMKDHCLPQPLPPKIETTGIISSNEVEKAQKLRRTKINIETLIRQIPGTTCVSITIVNPEERSLLQDSYKASATALVKHKNEKYDLNTNQIARMIAGGVAGLSPENVTVTLTYQPLRPLPNFNRNQNLRRILYVVGFGFTTILLFVGIVVFLRKRKDKTDEITNNNEA